MKSNKSCILTINGGSSSIKFGIYEIKETLQLIFYGEIENIGKGSSTFSYNNMVTNENYRADIQALYQDDVAQFLIDFLEKQNMITAVNVIGHRIVYGMKHTMPERISAEFLDELKQMSAYDPEHMPRAIQLIEAFEKRSPGIIQIACFDTAFHASMPHVAQLLAIPRRYFEMGIQRYGFHGLSYTYLLEELGREAGTEKTKNKIILAHLGSGASLAAVTGGKSVDTSMGFTPTSGLPMGTRSGDLDPGVAWYLMQSEKMNPEQFNHLINQQSGLLGVSQTSSDMRELINKQRFDDRAAEAIELFCYQTKKWIGAFAAALGGLDILVFSGGIGEHAPEIRDRICLGLEFIGIELDEKRNAKNETVISTDESKVSVRVIPTNEQLMIARLVCKLLKYTINN